MNHDEILSQSRINARNAQLKSLNKPTMDTITTDSGKVLKLEEAWAIHDDNKIISAGVGESKRYFAVRGDEVKRVWVLVEVTP